MKLNVKQKSPPILQIVPKVGFSPSLLTKKDSFSTIIEKKYAKYKELLTRIEVLTIEMEELKEEIKDVVLENGISVKPGMPDDKFLIIPSMGKKFHHYNMGRRNYNHELIEEWARANNRFSEFFVRRLDTKAFLKVLKTLPPKTQARLAPDAEIYGFTIRDLKEKSCKVCGTEIKKTSKFCSECGTKL